MAARKGSVPWNKGLSKATDERVKKNAEAVALATSNGTFWTGRKHSDETKLKMAEAKRKLYASGWEPVCGRSKKYKYESPMAGIVLLDGTWEVKVAKYFDSIGVRWRRNKLRFDYIRPDGKPATYQPDFFVEDWDLYIEVKGYETDLDLAKWKQFPHKLEVWKKSKIQTLESGQDGNAAPC